MRGGEGEALLWKHGGRAEGGCAEPCGGKTAKLGGALSLMNDRGVEV